MQTGHLPFSDSACSKDQPDNEYERQRLARIESNAAKLRQLDVKQDVISLHMLIAPSVRKGNTGKRKHQGPKEPQRRQPSRASARLQGSADCSTENVAPVNESSLSSSSDRRSLLTQQEYMKLVGKAEPEAFVTDGHFKGWVESTICQQYEIADCACDAWNQNGGGKFSFKIDKSAIPASLRGQGWSTARAFSATQLKQNPNTFFYRNVAPHLQQAFGDWSDEEHTLFMTTAKAHGVGDKWGLFASHIPHRVGYQCSAYYRDVIIPACLVLDDRFRLSQTGKATFVG